MRRSGRAPITGFPTIWAQNIKDITLLQVGRSYSAIIDIARQASKDLGFKIEMQNVDGDALVNRVVTQPTAVDIADIEYWRCSKLIPRGVLQAHRPRKLKYWDKVVPIFTKGEYPDGRKVSPPGHPALRGAVSSTAADGTAFAKGPTDWATLIPTVYNADTLGMRPDLVSRADRALEGAVSIPSSRARPPSSTCPRLASWTPRWPSNRAATSSMATRAT